MPTPKLEREYARLYPIAGVEESARLYDFPYQGMTEPKSGNAWLWGVAAVSLTLSLLAVVVLGWSS